MTCNKRLLIDLRSCNLEFGTFGDGVKCAILGSGLLNVTCMLKQENFIVEGLKANLINISQLCDQNLIFKFIKNMCSMVENSST